MVQVSRRQRRLLPRPLLTILATQLRAQSCSMQPNRQGIFCQVQTSWCILTIFSVPMSTMLQSPLILIITSAGAAVVIIIAIYVFYRLAFLFSLFMLPDTVLSSRYRSKPEIPAVVPGMGNSYKPGQPKKIAPPGKDTEYYV